MKRIVTLLLVVLVATGHANAQSGHPMPTAFSTDPSVTHDSAYRAVFDLQSLRPVRPRLEASVTTAAFADTAPAMHHYGRNGAIVGASVGFVGGAIVGGVLSNECDNCSVYRGAVTYAAATGAASALVGAVIGGAAGRVIEWLRY